MFVRTSLLAIAISSAFAVPAHSQTLYRYVDAQGKVHYSDTPPPTNARETRTVTTDAAADQRAAEALREQNEELRKRAVERNKSPAEREREAKLEERKSRCAQLSGVVTALERGESVSRQDAKGNKTELGAADREFERLRAGQQFQMECADIAKDAAAAAAKARTSPAPAGNNAGAGASGAGGAPATGGSGAAPRTSGTGNSPSPSSAGSASGK